MAEMEPGVILVCVDVSVFLCGVGRGGGVEGRRAQLSCCLMIIDVVENDWNIGHALLFFVVGVLFLFCICSSSISIYHFSR